MGSVDKIEKLVRPYVTALFATAIVVGFFMGKVQASEVIGPAGLCLGFWFRDRTEKREEPKPPTPIQ